ncbi:hypothetical protein RJ498_000847 [Pluralibacter gergoviae]
MTDIDELVQRKNAAISLLTGAFEPGHISPREVDALSLAVDVMNELVEALEKAQETICEFEQSVAELREQLRTVELSNSVLESRTVTSIEPFSSFVTDADLTALHRFVECCDDPDSGGHDLGKERVGRLEKIGALQRAGRISYTTDFGDLLIAITDGIKWEAE